ARQPGRGPTPEASAQALARLQAAAAAFSAGRVDEAHAAYEEVIELDPANPTAFGGRGVSRVYQNRLVEALADYDLGIELGQRGVPAGLYVNRGLCLGRLGRHAAALADFERVLGLEPEHVGALSSRAHCLAQLERHEEALADFDAALRLGPPSATLHVNRGTSLAALGRCEEALADYDAALAWRGASGLSPAQADALRGFREIARGDAIALRRAVSTRAREAALERLLAANRQFERERFEDARASCDEALRQDPGRGEAYLLRGICQLRLGRYSEAVEDLNRARLLGVEGVKLYSNRGQALASLAAHAAATLDFSRVLELEPGNTEARALRGISKVALADPGSALVDLEVALAEDPGHTTAHLFRGVTLADFGRYAEALEDYDAALALGLPPEQVEVARTQRDQAELARAKAEPPTPGSRALGYATEGGALFAGGRYEEALAQFDRALAEDPDDPMHSLRRGACKVALQRFGEAVVDFDRALALEPALVVARTNRALARLNLGRFDEALADYAEVLEFEPRSVNALMGRASCLARQEKFSEAVGDLDRALALGGLPEGVAEQVRRQRERWAAEAAR
ncbi:MAG: tetratricopeptide repeat protein, partial [Planctomycetes bacterium]|nr:tetratricopeptide repeat protein [Planctomycetota bacterium]